MNKLLYYLCGIALIVFGIVLFTWFYGDFLYSINHITNPQYFARILSPLVSVYLGVFYIVQAIKNRMNLSNMISIYVLVLGLLISCVIMILTPYNIGGPVSLYTRIMDSTWRTLLPLSVLVSIFFSLVSLFRRQNPEYH